MPFVDTRITSPPLLDRPTRPRLRRAILAAILTGLTLLAVAEPGVAPEARAVDGPVISRVAAIAVRRRSAQITWTLDRPATGQVKYGRTKAYGRRSVKETSFDYTTHVQQLTGLRPGTRYHFRVISVDQSGNRTVSRDHAFTTRHVARRSPQRSTRRVAVPASIDATGERDASAALNGFLATVPDHSVIVFKAGGVYRMDHGLKVRNRRGLTFAGRGATLKAHWATIDKTTPLDSLMALTGGNRNIVIRNLNFDGSDPEPGVFRAWKEHNHAILVIGDNVRIHDVTVRRMGGDAFHLHSWSDGVRIRDSHVYSVGRNGLTIIAAQNALIERVAFDTSGYVTFDIEPNRSDQGARNIIFRRNTAGTWSDSFFSALGARGSVVRNIRVNRNRVTRDSLKTHVYVPTGRQDITFRNNRSLVSARGPVLIFRYINGLVVTGNHQPLISGRLASISDSVNVSYVD